MIAILMQAELFIKKMLAFALALKHNIHNERQEGKK